MGDSFCEKYPIIVKALSEEIAKTTTDIRRFKNRIPKRRVMVADSVVIPLFVLNGDNPSYNPNNHDFFHFVYVCKQFNMMVINCYLS